VNEMQEIIRKAQVLHEALPYIKRFHGRTFVIKYGGHAMVDASLADGFARDIVLMKYVGLNPIVVHGGGPQIDETLTRLNIKSDRIDGLRVTDDATMEVVEMVLSGKVNQSIVSLIGRHGGRAVGLSGVDDSFLVGEKIPGRNKQGEPVDIGRVGDIIQVRTEVLNTLVSSTFIPVIAPLAIDRDGRTLNVNADTVAGSIAGAMNAEKLVLMTDTQGVCDKDMKLIPELTRSEIEDLRAQGVISGGMIPKVECALRALSEGARKCHIIDGRIQHAVLLEIFTDTGIGTEISLSRTGH